MKCSFTFTRKAVLFLVMVASFATACAPVYKPPLAHPVHFTEAGQLDGLFGYGSGGVNAGMAYSFTDQYFLRASGYVFNASNDSTLGVDYPDDVNLYGDIGIGAYKQWGKHGYFSITGGLGYGYGRVYASGVNTNVRGQEGNFYRPFLLPQVGFTSKIVDFGIMPRLSYVHFTRFSTTYSSIHSNTSEVFFEPLVYFNIGTEEIKFSMMGGLAIPSFADEPVAFDYNIVTLGIGVYFHVPVK